MSDSRARRAADSADRVTVTCIVCARDDVVRAFDPVPLVPEYRTVLLGETFCSADCAFVRVAEHVDAGRPDLMALLRRRFAAAMRTS